MENISTWEIEGRNQWLGILGYKASIWQPGLLEVHLRCVKVDNEKIKKLRDAIRASPIKIWLMRPSGEKFDITTQPDFTVSKLKRSIDNVYGFDRILQEG